ncbi:MAG TPA: ChaN family lipoprotein [Thermohalobaculum sp.]|nr:ChaN family lipoprotein [Thermohalobaculum sp.]
MRGLLVCLAMMLVVGCAPRGSGVEGRIAGPGGAGISEASLVEVLRGADIVVIGEVHDSPIHHARQARLVRALRPGGIAFEMVPQASEEGIQAFLAQGGTAREIGPAIGWDRMRWPDWKMYAPVFVAAEGAYVAGGGVPRPELALARREGAARAYGGGAEGLGLDQPLDAALRTELEDEMIASHCNMLPREVATGMIESQRLRDARFAAAALRAYAAGGGKAVLITGNGHARTDRGVPAYLGRAMPELTVLSVGMIELAPGGDPAVAAEMPFDYVWFSEPTDRADPCAAFKVPPS